MTRKTWTMKSKRQTFTRLYFGDFEYTHTLKPKPREPRAETVKPPKPPVPYGPFRLDPVYRMSDAIGATPRFVGWLVVHPDSGSGWWDGPFYHKLEDARGFARRIADTFADLRNLSPIDEIVDEEVQA